MEIQQPVILNASEFSFQTETPEGQPTNPTLLINRILEQIENEILNPTIIYQSRNVAVTLLVEIENEQVVLQITSEIITDEITDEDSVVFNIINTEDDSTLNQQIDFNELANFLNEENVIEIQEYDISNIIIMTVSELGDLNIFLENQSRFAEENGIELYTPDQFLNVACRSRTQYLPTPDIGEPNSNAMAPTRIVTFDIWGIDDLDNTDLWVLIMGIAQQNQIDLRSATVEWIVYKGVMQINPGSQTDPDGIPVLALEDIFSFDDLGQIFEGTRAACENAGRTN